MQGLGDLQQNYGVVSKEALLDRAPEVIVELQGEGGDLTAKQEEARAAWRALSAVPAVQQGRVYVVEASYALIPGPRVVQLARRLAEAFHGEDR
jgi:iron complex transport system substrate-binding protein